MSDFELAHHYFETIVNSISVFLNAYLLYLIRFHSTYRVKVYQTLLTVDAALDFVVSLVTLIVQPVSDIVGS